MNDPQQRIADLSPERRRLLELLRRQHAKHDRAQLRPLERTEGVNTFPLSFAQQRLWFLDQFQPGSSAYTMLAAMRLTGSLNEQALARALDEVVRRHEILRTTFISSTSGDGQPVQMIAPPAPPSDDSRMPVIDLSLVPLAERDAAVQRAVMVEGQHAFDLARGPLLHTTLLRVAEAEHVLILTLHHIVADGWSQGVLLREALTLYRAFAGGQPSPLPALPIQYADYAVWQRQWLQDEVLDQQLTYWRTQLAGLPKLLVPTDYPRSAAQAITGARQIRMLTPSLTAALHALSQREGATLFQTLVTAFHVLLYRYTGQEDLAIGSSIANRNRAEIEGVIGFFVNTLVLRAKLHGNPTFRQALQQVREVTLAAYAHQDLPFEKLVEELKIERDLNSTPLFQVSLVLQNTPLPTFNLPPLRIELLETEHVTTKLDLDLSIVETGQGLRLRVQYNAELFAGATIERLLGHFQHLLESIVADPDRQIATLPLLTNAEARLLHEWNVTERAYPAEQGFQQLFEAQVARTPDAVAVVFADTQLTYAALDRRANQLAHVLQSEGVGPEVRVGICMDRSPELIISLLAILKAGGCYVPLDPSYPVERIQFVLADADAAVLLTKQSLVATLPPHGGCTLCLDMVWAAIAQQPNAAPVSGVQPSNLAYVLYTSGSTGWPKGVQITHQALVNFLHAMRREPGLRAEDTLLAVTTVAFDIAGLELFLPLLVGARLVLAGREVAADGARLSAALEQSGATVLQATPATWRMLLAAEWAGNPQLTALCGGEALPWELAAQVAARVGRLWNLYGPTETTVWSAATLVGARHGRVALGRPIANTQFYVLDGQGQLVPLGVPGELYIGGHGVARGYLNQPTLTAEKFVPDPFGQTPGARLYRTGDLVRYRDDGSLEFLGRIDQQVKLRGYRIELGEIETVLRQQANVADAVVMVREDRPGDQRLVAYVVANENQSAPDAMDLRALLKERLPEYMLPSAFVVLLALPLTPNGKVDRTALPAPEEHRADGNVSLVEPRTPLEELIAGVWASILRVERVSMDDNFFALGGHSLLATQVVTRLRQILGREIPLRLLFEAPTIAAFAGEISEHRLHQAVPLVPLPRDGTPLPLSFAQQRLWFLDQLQPGSVAYAIPMVVRLTGVLDRAALERSLSLIVQRHEILRTTFASDATSPTPQQQIAPATELVLSVVHLPDSADEATVHAAVQAVIAQPFDVQHGPLVRITLFEQQPTEHILALVLHHTISDGWSQGVLIRELAALYAGLVQDTPVALPALPIQYADYAVWQRQWLQGDMLEAQLSYWRQQLAEVAPLDLPTDFPRPSLLTTAGATVGILIPPALTAALHRVSQREGATLFMTLLAAFEVLLYRYSGQPDVAVGTPIAGRVRPELEGLIGLFVNTLLLRTDLSGNPSFEELVARVRSVCLGAYAQQDVPFELLVEAVQPDRDVSRTPLFQVMFVLQNTPRATIDLSGLTLEPFGVESTTAKFDLSCVLAETASGLVGSIEYRTDLFAAATIARMATHYRTLLEAIVTDPHQRIDYLPLLTETERRMLLHDWNATATPYPQESYIHELVAAQAERTPDAIAVVYEDETLSYHELNQRANQLAHYLRTLGAGPGARIGLCVDRSPDLVIGLLGILKTGAAYVPLDPTYPRERLAFMRDDAGIALLVTHESLRDPLAAPAVRVVCLDRDAATIDAQPEHQPALAIPPDTLAYVIYTSGSTGQPKGVLVEHRHLSNTLCASQSAFGFRPDDCMPCIASFSFDIALFELFCPLLVGGRVVLLTREQILDLPHFVRTLETVTVLHTLPSLMRQIAGFIREHDLRDRYALMRQVLVGGDAVAPDLLAEIHAAFPKAWINVLYGPTEAAIICATHPVAAGEMVTKQLIGKPMCNTALRLYDRNGQLVPVGVPGELYIGGASVTRGYLNQPTLTAEKFVPDPFGQTPGARLYRTGDLVRYRDDGTLEFLGRIDQQVKLRGYRIELGEIETVLRQQANVADAVVVVREERPGDQRLVAYVVANENRSVPDAIDLRALLKERLPEYMLPSAFVVLLVLPLTPNGKVDRTALPAPEEHRADGDVSLVEPRTPLEELIAGVWASILRVERVSMDDNFFALGGHSLLATQVVTRLRQILGREIPLRLLFEAPTIAAFAGEISEHRLHQAVPLVPLPRDGTPLPLSFAQQRLWFLNQLDPESTAYHLPTVVRLGGALHVTAVQQALAALIQRHESLRTTIALENGQPAQIIAATMHVPLSVVDVPDLPEAERAALIAELVRAEVVHPFDLHAGPLLRARLLRLHAEGTRQEHILILTLHHIVTDGWSQSVLLRELIAYYRGFAQDEAVTLPALPIQYADYARWQRDWLQGDILERQLAYWRQQLNGSIAVLELPSAHPRPPIQTFRGASQRLVLSHALTEEIKKLSRREGMTLFMVLLAGFQVLLARYTGHDDIVVGSPIASRTQPEVEGLIGCFLNTLALRTDLSGDPTFRDVLRRVREVTLGAYDHQDLPFEKLVEDLQPERMLFHTPIFQVMFNLLNTPETALAVPDLEITPVPTADGSGSKFDLTLYAHEEAQQLHLRVVYNCDLFEPSQMIDLLQHVQSLLEGMTADPDSRISLLSLQNVAAQQCAPARRLPQLSHPFVAFERDALEQSIPERFAAQASRHPSQIAVKTKQQALSYQALHQASLDLAHTLIDLLGGGADRVALLFDHDALMIVGMLGVLQAGKTYVPLDPAYPRERIQYMVADSCASALVTTSSHLGLAYELTHATLPIINLDDPAAAPSTRALPRVSPDMIAYLLYTSGSTGQPKGVMQSHRNVLHHIRAYTNRLHISAEDRLTLFSSYSFDAAVMDIFGALLNGAAVYPIPIKEQDAAHVVDWLRAEELTICHATPTVYRYVLTAPEAEAGFAAIRMVVLGGEEAQQRDVDLFKQRFSSECLLINGLGPTESTLALQYVIDHQTTITRHTVPVGYPVEDTEIILLNRMGEQGALYGVGEIVIRSPYLALGYWNQPQLTEAVFLPDPDAGNKRLYRTGDLGRWLPDGSLEFIGRKDFQVKIRGYRIEVGEIETHLRALAAVKDAVVVAQDLPSGENALVAYLVLHEHETLTASATRRALQQQLPDYMLPAALVFLETLPLTPNGKVDRRALPRPDLQPVSAHEAAAHVRTPAEELLTGIWCDVLRREQVGAFDNFFELGGHSLLATQVMSRIRATFHTDLPLRAIFEAPTIADLAERIAQAERQTMDVPPLVPIPRTGRLPLSFAQQRLWFLDQLQPASATYHIPAAMRLTGQLHVEALEHSLSEMVRRHEVLRTAFAMIDGQPVPTVLPARPFRLTMSDLRSFSEAERDHEAQRLATAEIRQVFDLAQGPFVRCRLIRLDDQLHLLVLTIHHLVSDGWSMGIFIRELVALYEAACAGNPHALPDLPIQYIDFAAWQRRWLAGSPCPEGTRHGTSTAPGAVLVQQLSYWKQQLADVSTLELPTDRPRPAIQTFHGALHRYRLSPSLAQALRALSRREDATLFMTLLAAFQTLLFRYTGQDDIVVGTPIANRNRAEIEPLIGFFANTLVLRTDLAGNPSFRELLRRVREVCLQAYAHQDLPFDHLVEAVQPARDLSRNPLFQVMFVLQNSPLPTVEVPELKLMPVEVHTGMAKFDLACMLDDRMDGLSATIEYSTDLFDSSTIARMAAHFQTILERMVIDPEQRVTEVDILTASERRHILNTWNATEAAYAGFSCLHQVFEEQVDRTPDATAVIFENRCITYRELDHQANHLAHSLQGLGVEPETCVAVCMERSPELVVGLLGILKAGGAYVPLDPTYPQERLSFMLQDTQAAVLLTQERLLGWLPAFSGSIVCLDRDGPQIARQTTARPYVRVEPQNLAYAIYTSGSTGTPKGVAVEHRSMVTYLAWFNDTFGRQVRHLPAVTNVTFDASLKQLFAPLLRGEAVWLLPEAVLTQPTLLVEALNSRSETGLNCVPSLWNSILQAIEAGDTDVPTSLTTLLVGGEQLTDALVARSIAVLPHLQIWNLYGPTEATANASAARILADAEITIGRPIAHMQSYILDDRLQPVPVGVAGELYLGGIQLARGYLQRPDLTAEKFVPNPFSLDPGSRLYRTGDRVRYRADGAIEYLGRADQQVKIRGFRIELGEIEAALRHHVAVQDAVVIVREETGDKRLVAYIVGKHKNKGTKEQRDVSVAARRAVPGTAQHHAATQDGFSDELRDFLRTHLPDYMVPSAFVMLHALPLTPTGKIDRKALPIPDQDRMAAGVVAPRDHWEHWLAQLWADLLGRPAVGVTDNFFALGGHSLLAVRMMAQIQQRLGRSIPLVTLLQAPTIEQLAVQVREHGPQQPWSPMVPLQPHGERRPLFLIHPIGGTVLCYADLARLLGPDQPVYGLQARGVEPGQIPQRSVAEMAAEYLAAIQGVQPEGPYRLGGWSFGGVVAFEIACRLQQQGEPIELLALIDSRPPAPAVMLPDDTVVLQAFLQDLGGMLGTPLGISATDLAPLGTDARLSYVLAQAQQQQALPPGSDLQQLRRLVDVFYANLSMLSSYQPVPTSLPAAVLLAEATTHVGEVLAAWRALTTVVHGHVVPGTHYTLLRSPHVQAVADWFAQHLAAVPMKG